MMEPIWPMRQVGPPCKLNSFTTWLTFCILRPVISLSRLSEQSLNFCKQLYTMLIITKQSILRESCICMRKLTHVYLQTGAIHSLNTLRLVVEYLFNFVIVFSCLHQTYNLKTLSYCQRWWIVVCKLIVWNQSFDMQTLIMEGREIPNLLNLRCLISVCYSVSSWLLPRYSVCFFVISFIRSRFPVLVFNYVSYLESTSYFPEERTTAIVLWCLNLYKLNEWWCGELKLLSYDVLTYI